MGWIYLSSPKLQWCDCWSLGMDKWFRPTHYWACDYLSMLGLKLIHVIKRCPWYSQISLLRGLLVQYPLLHGLSQQCQLMHGNYYMICYCSFRVRKQIILWTHKRFPIPPLKGELWTICCVLKKNAFMGQHCICLTSTFFTILRHYYIFVMIYPFFTCV